jgi:hypothetical protein
LNNKAKEQKEKEIKKSLAQRVKHFVLDGIYLTTILSRDWVLFAKWP